MFFFLSDGLTRKFVDELRAFWQYHPKFRHMVGNIQGKYSFKERPQQGIIVKTSGGSHVSLAPDHYKGMVYSYCYLAKRIGKPGLSVEWVREDARAIQDNGGEFPSPPGAYFIDVVSGPENGLPNNPVAFFVDPLLDVRSEQVPLVGEGTYQLTQTPVVGSLRLFEMPAGFLLYEGTNYTLDEGQITLNEPLTGGRWVQADYRYEGASVGPFPLIEQHANNSAIPGVVVAFGRRVEIGDQLAVVVQDARHPAALEYGGRWAMTVEFEIMATDVYDQRELTDWSVMALFAIARSRLSTEGIEILNVGLGGESEQIRDETGDDYMYNGTFTLDVETEWAIHVPLTLWLRQAAPLTNAEARVVAGLPDDELPGQDGNIQPVADLGLEAVRDPYWAGRHGTFEVIR